MPDRPTKIYWDACVFLSFINGEPEERVNVIQQLMEEASTGKHEIVTSAVSIVEVAFGKAEQDGHAPNQETLEKIEQFWLPDSPIRLMEFHRLVARDARDLVRLAAITAEEVSLKPLDAIHLASAQRLEVGDFHTYDGNLLKRSGSLGFPIQHPWTAAPRLPGV
jgi:predicted nucleic acid-binding protein